MPSISDYACLCTFAGFHIAQHNTRHGFNFSSEWISFMSAIYLLARATEHKKYSIYKMQELLSSLHSCDM